MDGGTKTSSNGRPPNYVRGPSQTDASNVWKPNIWSRIAVYCLAHNRRSYLVARHERPRRNQADSGRITGDAGRDDAACTSLEIVSGDDGSDDRGEGEIIMIETIQTRYVVAASVTANLILILFMLIQLRVTHAEVLEEIKTQNAAMSENTTRISRQIAQITADLEAVKLMSVSTDSVVSELVAEALKKEQFRKWSLKAKELNPELQIPPLEELESAADEPSRTEENPERIRANPIAYKGRLREADGVVTVTTPGGATVSWTTDGTGTMFRAGERSSWGGSGFRQRFGSGRRGSHSIDGASDGPDAMPNGKHVSGERF